jgi:hypothetical protein
MPRKRRWYRHRPDKYRGGRVVVNRIDYTRHDYMSPGKLVAWAEWVPHQKGADKHERIQSQI